MLLNGLLRLVARRRFRSKWTITAIRKLLKKLDRPVKMPSGMESRVETIVGLECEWFTPQGLDNGAPLMLYFPGGGFVLPAMNAHRDMIVHMCHKNGCRALLAQYRLGPEHKMPTGQRDGLNIYRHLLEELNEKPENLFLAGDSAGGGIVLSTLQQARDAKLPMAAGGIMLSPGADLTLAGTSIIDNLNKDPLFHISALLWMLQRALPPEVASNNPLVSPALGDFAGLPPLLLEVGSTEMMLDSSTLVAQRAQEAQVPVELTISPYSPHVYPIMTFLPEAKAAHERMSQFMQRLNGVSSLPVEQLKRA